MHHRVAHVRGPRGEDVEAPLRVGLARPSGQPDSSYGPYCVNIVTITEPSSVSDGSIEDGHSTSRYGDSDGTPRQASCHARSRKSIDGQNATPERISRAALPRRCTPS